MLSDCYLRNRGSVSCYISLKENVTYELAMRRKLLWRISRYHPCANRLTNHFPHTEGNSNSGSFIAYGACFHREFAVRFSFVVQLNLFDRKVSKYRPRSKQYSRLLKIFLENVRTLSSLEILAVYLRIFLCFSCKACGVPHICSSSVNSPNIAVRNLVL